MKNVSGWYSLPMTIIMISLLVILSGGCTSVPADTPTTPPVVVNLAGRAVHDFHYQLQDPDLQRLADSDYDLLVIDYSRDGSAEQAFTREEITALQNSGDGKLVLAYLSIGEAEDYRKYWQSAWDDQPPAWLLQENPNWPGNYLVAYWNTDWQQIIYAYLDRILAAGYDGVYLDTIESYQSLPRFADADRRMADWVINLAAYAHRQSPDFLIVPQNAAGLAVQYEDYRAVIDALGQEDLFYGYPDENRLSSSEFLDEVLPNVEKLTAQGIPVLAIAYTNRADQIEDNTQRCREHGLLCFATTRALDHFVSQRSN